MQRIASVADAAAYGGTDDDSDDEEDEEQKAKAQEAAKDVTPLQSFMYGSYALCGARWCSLAAACPAWLSALSKSTLSRAVAQHRQA